MGDLPGSTLLGVLLHAIRTLALTQVMPRTVLDPSTQWIAPTILASWSITEVARYPMYMFPSNKRLRSLRMVTPLVTFPIGVLGEAYGAYWVLFQHEDQPPKGLLLKLSLVVMLLVQGGMGPTMAYPHLLKKGLPELGW